MMVAKCKKCGEPIAFKKLENGRLCPTNVDGSDHFDRCRQMQFEQTRNAGKLVTKRRQVGKDRFVVEEGYEVPGRFVKTTWHYENAAGDVL